MAFDGQLGTLLNLCKKKNDEAFGIAWNEDQRKLVFCNKVFAT